MNTTTMSIKRDGKEYELTEDELRLAWTVFERSCVYNDIKDEVEQQEYIAEFLAYQQMTEEELIEEAQREYEFHEDMYGYRLHIKTLVEDILDSYDYFDWIREEQNYERLHEV